MCLKFPNRRIELDRYEATMVELSNIYGFKFYDYHCQFSAKAAAALRDYNIKVDWSIKDLSLLTLVMGNARINTCEHCSSTMHLSNLCPQVGVQRIPSHTNVKRSLTNNRDVDKYGRKRMFHKDQELCNNFNDKSCNRQSCVYAHMCALCYSNSHGASSCGKKKVNKVNEK